MIKIDYRDPRPIYEQVVDGIEELALRGALPADTQIPSVRQLAMELSINPNTIQRAYGELERRGVIYAAKGRGNLFRITWRRCARTGWRRSVRRSAHWRTGRARSARARTSCTAGWRRKERIGHDYG